MSIIYIIIYIIIYLHHYLHGILQQNLIFSMIFTIIHIIIYLHHYLHQILQQNLNVKFTWFFTLIFYCNSCCLFTSIYTSKFTYNPKLIFRKMEWLIKGSFLSEDADVFVITPKRRTFFFPETEHLNFDDWKLLRNWGWLKVWKLIDL